MVATNKATKKRASSTGFTTQNLLDLDLEESSSDSDFRIEDHDNDSDDFSDNSLDDDDDHSDDDDDNNETDSDADESDDFSAFKNSLKANSVGDALKQSSPEKQQQQQQQLEKAQEALERAQAKLLATPICCACLGDRSDDTNEIVECDNCGISVHEACYGISDSNSVSSTVSSCSTEPWFCEACKANAPDPACELCPNKGGIFKETDVGKWVHLICALYVPGVAFGEVDQLSSVTLFEMPYSKWGAKTCSLCEDVRFARTGVCIGCDAGMCKTYFHVTCAQAAGLLSEAHSEEADHADPFYAHCKIHSDKALIKHRKRNYNGLKLKMEHRRKSEYEQKRSEALTEGQKRIARKLKKHRTKYVSTRSIKSDPWVPTQKIPRLLTTSATVCRKLILKAELMGINAAASEFQEAQMAALADVRKKWHIPPAFSVEFIGYYLDRISRIKEISNSLQQQVELNKKLVDEQQTLRDQYDQKIKEHADQTDKNSELKQSIKKLHQTIQALCPNKNLPSIENIGRPPPNTPPAIIAAPPARPMVPTAAALKMGVGFPLTNLPGTNDDTNRILSTQCQNNSKLMYDCGICKRCTDQHLLAKCDTCHLHYHLGCLNPPLTRHPKKSKLYGWQCSECVKSDDSDTPMNLPTGPRKSRTKYNSKDGTIVPVDPPQTSLPLPAIDSSQQQSSSDMDVSLDEKKSPPITSTAAKHQQQSGKFVTKKHDQKDCVEEIEEVLIVPTNMTDLSVKIPKLKKLQSLPGNKSQKSDEYLTNNNPSETESTQEDPLDISNSKDIIPEVNKKITTSSDIPNDPEQINHNQKNRKGNLTSSSPVLVAESETLQEPAQQLELMASVPGKIDYTNTNGTIDLTGTKHGHFTSELISDNQPSIITTTINATNEQMTDVIHKQNRKRRKEKHRSRHGSDGERSQSKEHKKKRKRDKYDLLESIPSSSSEGIPKIKIKFKALPLPGETLGEPQFFYVSADMVRPAEISRSPTIITEAPKSSVPLLKTQSPVLQPPIPLLLPPPPPPPPPPPSLPSCNASGVKTTGSPASRNVSPTKIATTTTAPPLIRTRRLSVLLSPQRIFTKESRKPNTTTTSSGSNSMTFVTSTTALRCDVCEEPGTVQDIVKCDECKKNYHFQCLEPPLKKTPKRRGYSWHCADCDPTDTEST